MRKRAAVLALILCTAAVLAAGSLLPFSGRNPKNRGQKTEVESLPESLSQEESGNKEDTVSTEKKKEEKKEDTDKAENTEETEDSEEAKASEEAENSEETRRFREKRKRRGCGKKADKKMRFLSWNRRRPCMRSIITTRRFFC